MLKKIHRKKKLHSGKLLKHEFFNFYTFFITFPRWTPYCLFQFDFFFTYN